MRRPGTLAAIAISMLLICSCADEYRDAAVIGVDFDWQRKDKGSQENPEIHLTGVPPETVRFYVGLVDLNNNGFSHGGGFADNDGSGIIARGAAKGSYNGPDPPFPNVIHEYEITVTAYDQSGKVIGIGKTAKKFTVKW